MLRRPIVKAQTFGQHRQLGNHGKNCRLVIFCAGWLILVLAHDFKYLRVTTMKTTFLRETRGPKMTLIGFRSQMIITDIELVF